MALGPSYGYQLIVPDMHKAVCFVLIQGEYDTLQSVLNNM
jgi:hypothetical protein